MTRPFLFVASSTPTRARRRRLPPLKLADLPWRKIATGALVVGALAALLYSQLEIEAVHTQAARLNASVAFALLVVLPLVGFPASLLHVAAGIRFGAGIGLALVSLSILLQLLASYALVNRWRTHFERSRWLKRVRERIPDGAHASVCIFAVLLPGAPYAAINYTLPLVGVPLRTFLLCAWPLHSLRSTVTVFLGDQSAHLTATRLAVLIGYAALILAASWWTYRRLQSQFASPPPAAGDRKQPA